jgi:glucose 1-dehydrogenase
MENKKIVLISGGLGDIGQAIAILLGQQDFRVAISDQAEEKDAESQLDIIRSKGCKNLFYKNADVSSEVEVTNWLDTVEEKWGIPQIVIPNAGIVVLGSLVNDNLPTIEIRRQLDVNFWGSYYVAVQAAKRMRSQALPGRIIFIGSWAAERPDARIPAYCISKASIRMLCKTLALELANDDILVNEIAPGIVAGGLSKKNQEKDPELLKRHLNSIPVHNLVSVEEIAKHVLRLSDFEDMSITGSTLLIDGGLSLTSKMSL